MGRRRTAAAETDEEPLAAGCGQDEVALLAVEFCERRFAQQCRTSSTLLELAAMIEGTMQRLYGVQVRVPFRLAACARAPG